MLPKVSLLRMIVVGRRLCFLVPIMLSATNYAQNYAGITWESSKPEKGYWGWDCGIFAPGTTKGVKRVSYHIKWLIYNLVGTGKPIRYKRCMLLVVSTHFFLVFRYFLRQPPDYLLAYRSGVYETRNYWGG